MARKLRFVSKRSFSKKRGEGTEKEEEEEEEEEDEEEAKKLCCCF